MCVERAFGALQQRWGVLWKPLRTRLLTRQILIIRAAICLHNLCVDAAVGAVPSQAAGLPRRKWQPRHRTATAKRAAVARRLQRAGLRRPPLPQH